MDKSNQKQSGQDGKNGGEMAEKSRASKRSYAKSDVRYWEGKLFHDAYTKDGRRI